MAHAQFLSNNRERASNENTPEEIQSALSNNIAHVLGAVGSMITTRATSPGTEIDVTAVSFSDKLTQGFMKAIGALITENAQDIGSAIGSVTADSVRSFREAQDVGEDGSKAVGAVLANSLREANNNAQATGDHVQEIFTTFAGNIENTPEKVAMPIAYIEEGVERFLGAVAIRADQIGSGAAEIVNDVLAQKNTGEQVGHTFGLLLDAFQNNAEGIGEIMSETLAGLEGVTEESLNENKEDFITTLQNGAYPTKELETKLQV